MVVSYIEASSWWKPFSISYLTTTEWNMVHLRHSEACRDKILSSLLYFYFFKLNLQMVFSLAKDCVLYSLWGRGVFCSVPTQIGIPYSQQQKFTWYNNVLPILGGWVEMKQVIGNIVTEASILFVIEEAQHYSDRK